VPLDPALKGGAYGALAGETAEPQDPAEGGIEC